MRFKARIWKTGNARVLTIPAALDAPIGAEYWVTLEVVDNEEKQAGTTD